MKGRWTPGRWESAVSDESVGSEDEGSMDQHLQLLKKNIKRKQKGRWTQDLVARSDTSESTADLTPRWGSKPQSDWSPRDESLYGEVDPENPENLPNRRYSPVHVNDDSSDEYSDMNLANRKAPEHEFLHRKGQLLKFYRNGDPHFKGLTSSVNHKQFPTFETLLVWLNEKIPTTAGVKYIFRIPDGKEVNDVAEFQQGSSYVVSSVRKIIRIDYGDSRERFWHNRMLSATKVRKDEKVLFSFPDKPHSHPGSRAGSFKYRPGQRGALSPPQTRPRVLVIRSNTNRTSRQKVILNPQTSQTFEDMLEDIAAMVKMEYPPVTALWTGHPPYRKVQSFSQMFRGLKNYADFLACGTEGIPMEMMDNNKKTTGAPKQLASPRMPVAIRALQPGSPTDSPPVVNGYHDRPPIKPTDRQKNPSLNTLTIDDQPNNYPVSPKIKPVSSSQSLDAELSHHKPYRRAMPQSEPLVKAHIHGRLREFHVPRYGQEDTDGERPSQRLLLDWVYGYRGRDARNNLHVLPSGELLYFTAAVAVVLDRPSMEQSHYTGHNEDISCIAVHPNTDNPLVATGQVAAKSSGNVSMVRIWNPHSLETVAVIGKSEFRGGVSSVGFSGESIEYPRGAFLLTVDEDEKHTLSIWDWKQARLIAKTTTSADTVVWAAFHPQEYTTIVSFGMQHIYFWKLFWEPKTEGTGRILRDKKSGVFEVDDLPKFVTSLAFSLTGDVISGDSNGRITVWRRDGTDAYVINEIASHPMKHAHAKSVFALSMLQDGTLLSGGGNDIKAWDTLNGYRAVKERSLPESMGFVRTLVPQRHEVSDGNLFVGTTNNLILEGSMQEKFGVVIQGHSEELWGAAVHPSEFSFVTAGYDQQVTLWDMMSHSVVWRTNAEKPCLSVAVDPSGRYVAVGTTVGRFIILDASSGQHMASIQVGSESLDAIKFSPDGRLLAMGSHDHNIYIYEVLDRGQVYRKYKTGILQGHHNFLTHLDWSRDSRYIQSVSGDYDHLFWDVMDMREMWASKMRDVEWSTYTCILGYNALGAWSNLREGEDLNTMCRSHNNDLLAVGDNQGAIRLYKYPCAGERPDYQVQKKYTGHISSVRFSQDDVYLISSGGTEAAIMQWRLVDPTSQDVRGSRYE